MRQGICLVIKENFTNDRSHDNIGSWAHEPFIGLKLEIFDQNVCSKKSIVRQGIWLVIKENSEKAGLTKIKVHGLMNLFLV